MGTKPSYFKTGIFVIVAVFLLLVAVVVFGSGLLGKERIFFETYIDDSVHGLSVGSPVKYRGVEIGRVERIGFVSAEYELPAGPQDFSQCERYVLVVASIEKGQFPGLSEERARTEIERLVSNGLRIQLASHILTGVAYLEANYVDRERFGFLKIAWQPKRPYVPSAPSEISTLKDSVDQVLAKLKELDIESIAASVERTFTTLNAAIVDVNIPALSQEVRGLAGEARQKIDAIDTVAINEATLQALLAFHTAVEDVNVPELGAEAKGLLTDARDVAKDLQALLAKPETAAELANLPKAVAQLNKTLERVDRLVVRQMPQIEQTITNLRAISENLKELTRGLEQDPAGIILSKPPAKSEALE